MASCERFIRSSLLIYYLIESGILMSATTSIRNGKNPHVDAAALVAVYLASDADTKSFMWFCNMCVCVMEWLSYFTTLSDKRWELNVMWQTSQTQIIIILNGYWFSLLSIPFVYHSVYHSRIHPSIYISLSLYLFYISVHFWAHHFSNDWLRYAQYKCIMYISLIPFHIHLSI